MQFHFIFRNLESSPTLEAYAKGKLGLSLKTYVPKVETINVSFAKHGDYLSCNVSLADQEWDYCVIEQGPYLFDCIDRLAERIEADFRNQKKECTVPLARLTALPRS